MVRKKNVACLKNSRRTLRDLNSTNPEMDYRRNLPNANMDVKATKEPKHTKVT